MFESRLFRLIVVFCFVNRSYGDWVSDWMSPMHEILTNSQVRRQNTQEANKVVRPLFDEEELVKMVHATDEPQKTIHVVEEPFNFNTQSKEPKKKEITTNDDFTLGLKVKLENTLQSAEEVAQALRDQIIELAAKETRLKEAIAGGRSGVTTVTVQTLKQAPRTYILREGRWYLCQGMVQKPTELNSSPGGLLSTMFRAPRCIGQEQTSEPDPCVFNSLIKYDTVPMQRRSEYLEDHFLCLKNSFNSSLEQFMSVPRHVVNETCTTGLVRNLDENMARCGLRIMSEYTYYPERSTAASALPLEYCTERDGSCKLIVAWHVSNTTIENFEFLKNEYNFKKYFLTTGPFKNIA